MKIEPEMKDDHEKKPRSVQIKPKGAFFRVRISSAGTDRVYGDAATMYNKNARELAYDAVVTLSKRLVGQDPKTVMEFIIELASEMLDTVTSDIARKMTVEQLIDHYRKSAGNWDVLG